MDLRAERAALLEAAQSTVDAAKAARRDLTTGEHADLELKFAKINKIDAQLAEVAKSQELIRQLAGTPTSDAGPSMKGMKNVSTWAKTAMATIQNTAVAQGQKSTMIPIGTIQTAPIVDVVERPEIPRTFLDVINVEETNSTWLSYLRQNSFVNNAAVVPPGELKPVSSMAWEEYKTHCITIAHMSEDLPNQWFTDFAGLLAILEHQMRLGLLEKTEDVLLNGWTNPTDPSDSLPGILTTSGVQATAFQTDMLTTMRKARLNLETAGFRPTAWVMNPTDLATLDLMREGTGATAGGFLFSDAGVSERILGPGVKLVTSLKLPQGTAMVADWSGVSLLRRDPLSSVAFTQHKDLAQRNQTVLRVEHRIGWKILQPAAITTVELQ